MVARRHVFYLAGFDPIDTPAQHRRFSREAQKFARIWNVSTTVSDLEAGQGTVQSWQATTRGHGWTAETVVEVLDWQDIVREEIARPVTSQLVEGMTAFADFLVSGTAYRYFKAAWPYGIFFLVPFLTVLLFGAVGIGAGVFAARMLTDNFVVLAAIAALLASDVFVFLMRWPGRRWRVRQALADWVFAREYMYGRRPAVDERLQQFAQRLVSIARAHECDEIVVVGHSLGATMALMTLSRALGLDGEFARRGPKICLLTVGSTIPKLALHPAASQLRACAARIAADPSIAWTEYQARRDAISFYKFDPVTLKRFDGDTQGRKPLIRLVGIKDMLTPESYSKYWLHQMRLHYQFVMANERRTRYDYFVHVCGPVEFERLSLAPDGALDFIDTDGTLRMQKSIAAASGSAP